MTTEKSCSIKMKIFVGLHLHGDAIYFLAKVFIEQNKNYAEMILVI